MTKNDIIATAEALAKEHSLSILSAEDAELLNAKEFCFFDAPLVGVADAEDSWFRLLKEPQAVGEHYITPSEWLNGAKSVISIFVPYSKAVKKANAALPKQIYHQNVPVGQNHSKSTTIQVKIRPLRDNPGNKSQFKVTSRYPMRH